MLSDPTDLLIPCESPTSLDRNTNQELYVSLHIDPLIFQPLFSTCL